MGIKQRIDRLECGQQGRTRAGRIRTIEAIDPVSGEVFDAVYLWPHPLYGQAFTRDRHAQYATSGKGVNHNG